MIILLVEKDYKNRIRSAPQLTVKLKYRTFTNI